MHIEQRGTGPALVMIHGWAMHCEIFAPLVAILEKQFTCYLVDLPGHGRSFDDHSRLDLAAIAEEISGRVPQAIWCGWSLGGLVALQASQDQAMRGLIMLCASPRFVKAEHWPQGMVASVFSGFAEDLQKDYRATLDRFISLEAQGSDHMREELRMLRDAVFAFGQPAERVLCEGLALLENTDLIEACRALKIPNLWCAGKRDRLVSPLAMQTASEIGKGQFIAIQGGGHAPFLTHADQVAQAINDFSKTLA
ncbi:MAG: pimeloyl-ACP methyl ester esterase BioH [Arenimonas sp.]